MTCKLPTGHFHLPRIIYTIDIEAEAICIECFILIADRIANYRLFFHSEEQMYVCFFLLT